MNNLTKYILIAAIVAMGIFIMMNLITWLVVNTLLGLLKICLFL